MSTYAGHCRCNTDNHATRNHQRRGIARLGQAFLGLLLGLWRGEELELAGSVLLVVQVVLGNGLDNGLLGGAERVGTAGIVFSPVE